LVALYGGRLRNLNIALTKEKDLLKQNCEKQIWQRSYFYNVIFGYILKVQPVISSAAKRLKEQK